MPYSLDLLAASGIKVKKRSQWGPRHPVSSRTMALPGRYLFMHITVTRQTGSLDSRSRVVEDIGADRFPNTRMSYIALLHRGGEVHEGQPRGRKGAHTVNAKRISGFPYDLNAYGHALSYVGLESDPFGEAEIEAAARYFAALVLSGESVATVIYPHNKFAAKACPGAKVMAALAEINRRFKAYVKAGRLPGTSTPTPSEDDDMTPEQMTAWAKSPAGKQALMNAAAGAWRGTTIPDAFGDLFIEAVTKRVKVRRGSRPEDQIPILQEWADAKTEAMKANVTVAAVLKLVSAGGQMDEAAIRRAVDEAFDARVQSADIELVLERTDPAALGELVEDAELVEDGEATR